MRIPFFCWIVNDIRLILAIMKKKFLAETQRNATIPTIN